MLLGVLGQSGDEPRSRNDEPALTLDRFEDDRGDVAVADVLVDLLAGVCERLVGAPVGAARPAVGVGERQAVDPSANGPMPMLVGHDLPGRDIASGVRPWNAWSNVTTWTTRRLARDLRVLDGLGAGVREHRLLGRVAWRERVQAFGQLDVGLVGRDVETGVSVELELSLCCGDHLGRGVTDVQHRDPAGEVDQPVPVDVFDDRAGVGHRRWGAC